MSYQRMLVWLVKDEDLRMEAKPKTEFRPGAGSASGSERNR